MKKLWAILIVSAGLTGAANAGGCGGISLNFGGCRGSYSHPSYRSYSYCPPVRYYYSEPVRYYDPSPVVVYVPSYSGYYGGHYSSGPRYYGGYSHHHGHCR
jgi:hypothetical protein